jgi:primary-amine oxidase
MKRITLSFCLIALTSIFTSAAAHPMDPLDEGEIIGAAEILLNAGAAGPGAIFQSIDLREPSKEQVLAFPASGPLPRLATVHFRQHKESFRSIVNLTDGTHSTPVQIPIQEGQLGLTITEVFNFGFLFEDPQFLNALAARGLDTPEEVAQVFVTPLTAGSFGLPEEIHRIVRAQMYYVEGGLVNLYSRPIEGLQAVVDLDDQRVIEIIDTGVIPIPAENHNFDEATIDAQFGLRPALKPIRITQPEGANFTINGNFIEWQKWRFHLRFERRAGTVLSLVTYDGRSVLYQGSLAEIFVPYQDPDIHWFYRTYMDAGEFGLGMLASPLFPGLDLPENSVLLDAVIPAAIPDPSVPVVPLPLDNVIGVFERVTGNPAWRHFELFSQAGPQYEGRSEVELVVRMIAQVGNYDYILDWVFNQAGAIRVEVSLTGIDASKGVLSSTLSDPTAEEDTAHGVLVAPQLVATHHSHHFNFRLDLDIDGQQNSFALGELKVLTNLKSPRKSVWAPEETILNSEREGAINHGDFWRVLNPTKKNARGYNTSYLLEAHGHGEALLKKHDYARAAFIENSLWITAFNPDEHYASGDTPNQNPGTPGLPEYIANDESIRNTDIVLWPTVSFHHLTTAEDFPVLPREHSSFELKPANFFDRNPALDLRRAPFEVAPQP